MTGRSGIHNVFDRHRDEWIPDGTVCDNPAMQRQIVVNPLSHAIKFSLAREIQKPGAVIEAKDGMGV